MNLSIKNLSKSFNDKKIFDNFSYEFKEKGIYAISGESGVGKTTLLRIISGLDVDYSGAIVGGGFKNVSVAFQEYRLFPTLTAIENVTVTTDTTDSASSDAEALLSRLGFSCEELKKIPSELSGGMKQRVSLARAFLKKTPILLLDEPTKELDASLRDTVYSIILEESERRLVIIVTHHGEDIEKLNAVKILLN